MPLVLESLVVTGMMDCFTFDTIQIVYDSIDKLCHITDIDI